MRDTLTTPYQLMVMPHMQTRKNDTEWQSEEAGFCNNKGLVFFLYGTLYNYKSIRTATVDEKLACWTEGFSTTDLDFDSFRASLLAFCVVA